MKRAKIAEIRNHLSRYLKYVRRGGRVRIMDRDIAIAEVIPISMKEAKNGGRLERLEREGVLRRGDSTKIPEDFFIPFQKDKLRDDRAIEAVLEERRRGR